MDASSNYESPHVGENEILPTTVELEKFIAARGKEIHIMKKALLTAATSANKLAFQKLPPHMRRRAMSHNVKRLPRRLREIHKNQFSKSGTPQKNRRQSRKYVRRPYNLLEEYVRRRKRVIWLDTHIWHAKRFHMIEKWGYKLPYKPCDRSFRACYRATSSHCLIQDVSYYSCIEIEGEYKKIIDRFKQVTVPNSGLTMAAKIYELGKKEGNVFLTDIDGRSIGQISFLWRPPVVECKSRTLWLWVHPAYYKETVDMIIKLFQVELKNEVDLVTLYMNNGFTIKELKGELSRLRLTGPLSTAVLQNCLVPWEDNENSSRDWKNIYKDKISINNQVAMWKNLKHASGFNQLQPHTILGLVVIDPRYHIPKKRKKALPDYDNFTPLDVDNQVNLAESPIWNKSVRKIVLESKLSNAEICEKRKELLVPGSNLDDGVPVPVILIQRPGKKESEYIGYGHGWDIILPRGWSQPFWISLILSGARSGGLKESNHINFESGLSDILYPDTQAGQQNEFEISNEYRTVYFKKPPNKRTNYNKFSIVSPFTWNWKMLLSEWGAESTNNFKVLRDRNILRNVQEALTNNNTNNLQFNWKALSSYLVAVRIDIPKGVIKRFGLICLPTEEDLKKQPVEPKIKDILQVKRKQLRNEHKVLLKRLRKRRIRAKAKGKIIPIDKEMLTNYTKQMRELWLPEAKTIRHSCSKEVIGFVKYGDFSLTLGHGSAVGYIPMGSIAALLNNRQKNKVLLRNTNSIKYRLGTLKLIYD